jgi:hypothetical protein
MTDNTYALTHLYHPGAGAKIDIPLDLSSELTQAQALILIRSVDNLLSAGFTVNMPGLENGELVEEVAFVSRRTGNDSTPILAFYVAHPKMLKKFLHEYMDTPEQITAFENASGMKFGNLPIFDGDKDITKDQRNAAKYIIPTSPFKVVFGTTEKWKRWNEGDRQGQQPQKYELLRYMSTNHGAQQPAPTPIPPAMTYEQAQAVRTPGGAEFRTLDAEKLNLISVSRAPNITAEMKQAADIILNEMKQEGA